MYNVIVEYRDPRAAIYQTPFMYEQETACEIYADLSVRYSNHSDGVRRVILCRNGIVVAISTIAEPLRARVIVE